MSMVKNKAMLAKIASVKSNTPVLVVTVKRLSCEGSHSAGLRRS